MFAHDGMIWGNGLLMILFWIFLILLLIGGLSSVLSKPTIQQHSSPSETAISIAKRRYASGDISREEYLKLLQDLNQ